MIDSTTNNTMSEDEGGEILLKAPVFEYAQSAGASISNQEPVSRLFLLKQNKHHQPTSITFTIARKSTCCIKRVFGNVISVPKGHRPYIEVSQEDFCILPSRPVHKISISANQQKEGYITIPTDLYRKYNDPLLMFTYAPSNQRQHTLKISSSKRAYIPTLKTIKVLPNSKTYVALPQFKDTDQKNHFITVSPATVMYNMQIVNHDAESTYKVETVELVKKKSRALKSLRDFFSQDRKRVTFSLNSKLDYAQNTENYLLVGADGYTAKK